VLKWCHEKKYTTRWDADVMCRLVVENGHSEVLQWCHENGCNIPEEYWMIAENIGHLNAMKLYDEYGAPSETSARIHLRWQLYTFGVTPRVRG
jgi:hypothetical protein